jgi:hypothetical protein
MKTARLQTALPLIAALVLAGSLRADGSEGRIAFSDPSKPGTLRIRVWHGDVSVHGADGSGIIVKSDSEAASPTPRKDGMRVLSAAPACTLTEKDNVVSLECASESTGGGSTDFDITVPRSTSVVVNSARGDFVCAGVSGDIDVRTMGGDVRLRQVCAGALVETMHGDIDVAVKSLAQTKPLSFTSMHGGVAILLPAAEKACIRFRTHHGVILTDFDDKALVIRTEISRQRERSAPKTQSPDGGQAPAAASGDATPGAGSAAQSDDDWRNDVRNSVRDAVEEASEAAQEAADAAREGLAEARYQLAGPNAPIPPVPPLPPMTGGKTVSGTLNGGGVEIQAATLNGDIILKRAE